MKDEFDLTPITAFVSPVVTGRIKIPRHLAKLPFRERYECHIQSLWWARFRKKIIAKRKRCEHCGLIRSFHLHHITYVRLGRELPEDVRLLCVPCHERFHGKKIGKEVKSLRND